MRFIPLEYVNNGSKLGKHIYDSDGRILLKSGYIINTKMKKRLNDFGIYSVYIQDKYSDVELEEIIKPELRFKAIKAIKNTFDIFKDINDNTKQSNKTQKNNLSKKSNEAIESLNSITKLIVDEILSQDDIVVNLMDIKSMSEFMFQHSVNVAVLSLILGKALNYNKIELRNLCLGALLHDIGKTLIPTEIMWKESELSSGEKEIVNTHPRRGYDFLRGNNDISAHVRVSVLQHHEQVDGKGYPKGMSKNINKLAKIIAIANKYDNLTSDSPNSITVKPNDAFEYIMANAGTEFEFDIVKAFVGIIVPYPLGTLVKLSNGEIGVVKKIIRELPLRPILEIVSDGTRRSVDLVNEKNLVIVEICYEV